MVKSSKEKIPVTILFTGFVTHDTKRFILEKPPGYRFTPGQATSVSINLPDWQDQDRPFTFTSLNDDQVLEFTIKAYPERRGATAKLHQLSVGSQLLIEKPWGTITYHQPGVFIAGGTGITPFIAIFRQLRKDQKTKGNRLLFSNKTAKDVILEKELREIFQDQAIFTLTREENPAYQKGRINSEFLTKTIRDFNQSFYVCGPKEFVKDIKDFLIKLGANVDKVIFEK